MKIKMIVAILLMSLALAIILIGAKIFPRNRILSTVTSPIYDLITPVNIKERLASIRNRYRLKPDARMLNAVGEIHNFLTGEPKAPTEVVITDDGWNILYKNETVGSLPDLPDFKNYQILLEQWARRIAAAKNITLPAFNPSASAATSSTTYNIRRLIYSLQYTGFNWQNGNHNPALLVQALNSYTTLAMISIDSLESYDVLGSRPIAFLILTQIIDGKPHAREEALLAQTLGYINHAQDLAAKFTEQDPARWYIENNINALRKAAQASKPSQEVLLYTLLTMATENKGGETLFSLIKANFNNDNAIFPTLKAVTMQHKFKTKQDLPRFLRYVLYQQLPSEIENENSKSYAIISNLIAEELHEKQNLPKPISDFIKDSLRSFYYDTALFEQNLLTITPENAIGFITPEYYTAFFIAPFYSSFYIEANHDLYGLASQQELHELADTLSKSSNDFSQSFADLLNIINNMKDNDNVDTSRLHDALTGSSIIGRRPLEMLYTQAANLYKSDNLELHDVVHDLTQQLDSRPGTRKRFALMLYGHNYDIKMTERYLRAELAIAKEVNIDTELTIAIMSGDIPTIKSLLFLPNLPSNERNNIFNKLRHSKLPKQDVQDLFAEGVRLYPYDWSVRDNYQGFLMDKLDYLAVINSAQDWISQNPNKSGSSFIFSTLDIATAYYNMKHYEDALKILRPILSSEQPEVLNRYALASERIGRSKAAEIIFNKAKEHHPNSISIIQGQMSFFWSGRQHEKAANNLNNIITLSSNKEELRDAAYIFADEFGNDEKNALKAFEVFTKAGLQPEQQNEFTTFIRDKNPQLAFAMRKSVLSGTDVINKASISIDAYSDLEKAQGSQYAFAWLKKNTTPDLLTKISAPIYKQQKYQLLWTLIEQPDPEDSDYVWLLRTAASANQGFADGKKNALLTHYKTLTDSTSDYDHIARYLLGFEKIEEIYPFAEKNSKNLGIAAYFIAVKAISDRQYTDAADWLMLSISLGNKDNNEKTWAMRTLDHWHESGKFLKYQTGE